eukprot:2012942-Pyramimonas_sp.AAC.1
MNGGVATILATREANITKPGIVTGRALRLDAQTNRQWIMHYSVYDCELTPQHVQMVPRKVRAGLARAARPPHCD